MTRRDLGHHLLEQQPHALEVTWPDRQEAFGRQAREQLELHIMNERTALKWIKVIDLKRNFARSNSMDGLDKEAIRAT